MIGCFHPSVRGHVYGLQSFSDDGMKNTAIHANGVNYQKGKILKKSNLDLLVGREINEE